MIEKRKTTEVLKHTFTQEEVISKAMESAQEIQALESSRETLKEVSAQFKADIAKHEKRILELSRQINQGYDYRDMECEWHIDVPEPGMKSLFRLDSRELVRVDSMLPSEKQQELPLEQSAAAPASEETPPAVN